MLIRDAIQADLPAITAIYAHHVLHGAGTFEEVPPDQADMAAPIVVAKGSDLVAARIRELAQANDVPIVENPPLARALFATVDIDQPIPSEHYRAVAEIIGYVMKLKQKVRGRA